LYKGKFDKLAATLQTATNAKEKNDVAVADFEKLEKAMNAKAAKEVEFAQAELVFNDLKDEAAQFAA